MNFSDYLRDVASLVRSMRGPHSTYEQESRTIRGYRQQKVKEKLTEKIQTLAQWVVHENRGPRQSAMAHMMDLLVGLRMWANVLTQEDFARLDADDANDMAKFAIHDKKCKSAWQQIDSIFVSFENSYKECMNLATPRVGTDVLDNALKIGNAIAAFNWHFNSPLYKDFNTIGQQLKRLKDQKLDVQLTNIVPHLKMHPTRGGRLMSASLDNMRHHLSAIARTYRSFLEYEKADDETKAEDAEANMVDEEVFVGELEDLKKECDNWKRMAAAHRRDLATVAESKKKPIKQGKKPLSEFRS